MTVLNETVLTAYRTRLVGGFDEPLYWPATEGCFAEIRFTRDYERSALHELAHWVLAGAERRKLEDYGYWYAPDGRNASQQREFFRFEARPQAVEACFCAALDIPFDVSVDNLGTEVEGLDAFRTRVTIMSGNLLSSGLHGRAGEIYRFLCRYTGSNMHAEYG